MTDPNTPRLAVLSLGNVLMGDDALGPTVMAHLQAGWEPAADCEFLDLGTPGLDLHPHLSGREAVIFIDVVRTDGTPGEVRTYDREAVLKHDPGPRVSPHDPGVRDAILALEFAGGAPERVTLVGVIGAGMEQGEALSPGVRAAVPTALEAVLSALEKEGAPAVPRTEPSAPNLWWEAAD
ncbi:MAG TPA: hydrogenase maturation protease [Candidatus Krumholzibacteria bacterium]|nr:hydrogenase maturation protease [Candidatus Krumholzibacteria bacterium]HRX51831.1 hydrogenase maturation protease [Candidatus Krumholzibacteria bacterium]